MVVKAPPMMPKVALPNHITLFSVMFGIMLKPHKNQVTRNAAVQTAITPKHQRVIWIS